MASNPTSVTQQSQEDEQEALQETAGSDLNNLEMTMIDQDMVMVLQEQRIIDDAKQTEELATVQLEENKEEEVVGLFVQPVSSENSLKEITSVREMQPCSANVSVLESNSSQFSSKVDHKENSFIQIKDPEVQVTNDPLEALDYIKRYFESVYKAEALDTNEVETFTNRLPEISHKQNSLLMKEISTEEIVEVINSLPANKSP
ncbi:8489_t:CDS:2, partial [Gigaspora rosea]